MMDIDDLDFDDRIKDFLDQKLHEIKTNNISLEQKVAKWSLKQTGKEDNGENSDIITYNWKRCFNKKYVICYSTPHNFNRSLENVKPLLKWSSSERLHYKTFVYKKNKNIELMDCVKTHACRKVTNDIMESSSINSEAYIFIVMDSPNFLDNLMYNIEIKLLAQVDNKEILFDCPPLKLNCEDLTNGEIVCDDSLNIVENFMTALSSCEKLKLILMFPEEWNTPLTSALEIHCSLTKMDLTCKCKKYFVANRLSQYFDGTILELHTPASKPHTEICAVLYISSKLPLDSFLHHIHQHIPGLVVFPHQLLEYYHLKQCSEEKHTQDILQEFQNSIDEEFRLIKYLSGRSTSVYDLRSKLIKMEHKTDLLYLKCFCKLNNQ